MRNFTSSPSLDDEAGLAAGSSAGSPTDDAWGQSLPVWRDDGRNRLWLVAGSGLGVLACLALLGAVFERFSSDSGAAPCGSAEECNSKGAALASAPQPSAADLALAARHFQQACAQGHGAACNNLGLAHQSGRGVALDYERAREAFQQACSAGFGDGCNNEGALYEHGLGVPMNLGDAHRLYFQACRRGSALGCSNLGALYAQGRGVVADETEAARFFAEACNLGAAVGCSNLFEAERRAADQAPAAL